MIPLIVLLISFAVLRLTGYLGLAPLDNWNLPLRIALFLMFMLTSSAHWGRVCKQLRTEVKLEIGFVLYHSEACR